MGKLSKRYVLVDEDVYVRKFKNEQNLEKGKRRNPFTNPDIASTKKTRDDIYEVGDNNALDINNASLMLQRLVQQYAVSFARATNKQKTKKRKLPREDLDAVSKQNIVTQPGPDGGLSQRRDLLASDTKISVTPSKKRLVVDATPRSKLSPASEDDEPLARLVGAIPKTVSKASRVTISPNPDLKTDEKSMTADTVNIALGGGHLNRVHREQAKRLLTQMRDAGLTTDRFRTNSIREGGLQMTGSQVKNAIRDMIVSEPDQRKTNDQTVKKLVDFLKTKNVKVNLS